MLAPRAMSAPRIKGAAVREFLRWYVQRTSPEALTRALATLTPGEQSLFDAGAEAIGILPSSWYDARTVHHLIDAIFSTIPEPERAASVRQGARYAVEQGTRGIYRFVLERLTPDLYMRQIQRLWGMLHDNGEREIVKTGKTSCRSITRAWSGHHPVLCLATVETMAAIFEIMGCHEVRARRVACVSEGAHECVSELEWRRG